MVIFYLLNATWLHLLFQRSHLLCPFTTAAAAKGQNEPKKLVVLTSFLKMLLWQIDFTLSARL